MDNAIRNLLELAMLVGVGGLLVSAVRKLRAGQIGVVRCVACGRPTSRAYPRCKHCDAEQPEDR